MRRLLIVQVSSRRRTRSSCPETNSQMSSSVPRNQLLVRTRNETVSFGTTRLLQRHHYRRFVCSIEVDNVHDFLLFRMVVHLWFRHSWFDEHLAIVDRSRARKSNDSSSFVEVNRHSNFVFSLFTIDRSSGNIVIETKFFDGELEVSTSRVRLLYVWTSTSTRTNLDLIRCLWTAIRSLTKISIENKSDSSFLCFN